VDDAMGILDDQLTNHADTEVSQGGFTLVELIMTIVIVGVLAIVVAPRFFDNNVFQERGVADQVKASLRYAQKLAIGKHRFVCVSVSSNILTLNLDATPIGSAHTVATCPTPGSPSNLTQANGAPYNISRSGITISDASFSFDALGRPSIAGNLTISVGSTSIVIEAETGYVY
jgi:MSHA pilin protein MshC